MAVIVRDPTYEDIFTYEPLFGEKAAFRLTEVVSNSDGELMVFVYGLYLLQYIITSIC
jgi:hypothetical protein